MLSIPARTAGACTLLAGVLGLPVFAQATDPPGALTLGQAVERALAANPALQGFEFARKVQDARIQQAGQKPATGLVIELENVFGTGETRGLDSAEATFALSRVIELGDKRRLRSAVAQAGREGIDVERQAAQLDVLAELTRRFIRVAAGQQLLETTEDATRLAREAVDGASLRLRAARAPEAEVLRARASLARALLEEQHAGNQLESARRRLAGMWGQPGEPVGRVVADLYLLPEPAPFEALVQRLEQNPDFLRLASEARLRDAQVRLAESSRRSDFELAAGVRRLEATDDEALVFGFSMPLFQGKRSAPAIVEAQALRGQLASERNSAFLRAREQLFDHYQEFLQARAETDILQREVLPQLDKALKETRYAYERGRYSYLELVDGQKAYLDARRDLINAAATGQALLAEIERLTAEPLADTSN